MACWSRAAPATDRSNRTTWFARAWPYWPEPVLAIMRPIEASSRVVGENKGDVEIIVVDLAIGESLARHLEKGMKFSDATTVEQTATHGTSKKVVDECQSDERPGKTAQFELI